jgi:hypothetical protein
MRHTNSKLRANVDDFRNLKACPRELQLIVFFLKDSLNKSPTGASRTGSLEDGFENDMRVTYC